MVHGGRRAGSIGVGLRNPRGQAQGEGAVGALAGGGDDEGAIAEFLKAYRGLSVADLEGGLHEGLIYSQSAWKASGEASGWRRATERTGSSSPRRCWCHDLKKV